MLESKAINEALNKFAKRVIQQSRTNLTKGNKNVDKTLYNSLGYELQTGKQSFSLAMLMEDYGAFVDQGVKGSVSAAKAPNSPFKFGSGTGRKGGLTDGIKSWVQKRRFQFRNRETGKFYSYEQTAKLITRSIYLNGIKPSLFFTRPFENEFNKLPDELVEAFALELDDLMKFSKK